MRISTLPPAESFADVPATGLTDADLRALWAAVAEDARRAAVADLTGAEYRAYLIASLRSAHPDEDDDGPPDEIL